MPNISREERLRREAERNQETKRRQDEARSGPDGGFALVEAETERQREEAAARDERKPEWRPATVSGFDEKGNVTVTDERRPPGDAAKAINQMAGRAAIAQEMRPDAYLHSTAPAPSSSPEGEGTEILLLNGYQQAEGVKRQKGEVIRVPDKEARRLVNIGKAKFTDVE